MEREVGGVFRMGDTCTHVVDSCQCLANYNLRIKAGVAASPLVDLLHFTCRATVPDAEKDSSVPAAAVDPWTEE